MLFEAIGKAVEIRFECRTTVSVVNHRANAPRSASGEMMFCHPCFCCSEMRGKEEFPLL